MTSSSPDTAEAVTDGTKQLEAEAEAILELGHARLILEPEYLTIEGATPSEPRGMFSWLHNSHSSTNVRIPLYNVLWAERSGTTLTVDYASESPKSHLVPKKETFSVPAELATHCESWLSRLLSDAYGLVSIRKRAYVLVNPASGKKHAVSFWENLAKPLLEAARWELTVAHTQRRGHAQQLVQKDSLDITKFDVIIACSGDGLPHEIFNGLSKRPDAGRALAKLAVAHIPCGTGNAMATNLYGTNEPSAAALTVVKSHVIPLDLASITQAADDKKRGGIERNISFLSQALGIIAEIVPAGENLRWLGPEIGLPYAYLRRVIARKVYPCDLAFKVEVEGRDALTRFFAEQRRLAEESYPENEAGEESEGMPMLEFGNVEDKLPTGWDVLKYDNMGNFYCGNMAFMATGKEFFNASLPNDGLVDLVTVDGGISILNSVNFIKDVENGKLMDSPLVSYRKLAAYRVTPREQETGTIAIDGEIFPFKPFQVEVHRGLGRVLSKSKVFQTAGPSGWDTLGTA